VTPEQKIGAAISYLTDPYKGRAPYLAGILETLVRVESTAIPTLAVTQDARLLWSPEFVAKTATAVLGWGLYHEALHVLWDHIGRVQGRDPKASNICQDACINETAREAAAQHGVTLPAEWIYPESLKQPGGLTFEERYDLLPRIQLPQEGGTGLGHGECGSCAAGKKAQGETEGEEGEGRTRAEINRARMRVAEQIKIAKERGKVPAGLVRWADEVLAPARVNWWDELLCEVRTSVARASGYADQTYMRASRRQAGVGYGSNSPVLPGWFAPLPEIGVIIDTSGSMSDGDLRAAFSELQGVLDTVTAQVSVVAVDASDHGVRVVTSINDVVLTGGGGTDMTPGFRALQKHTPAPNIVVVLTDGHVGDGYPGTEPGWCHTIWVTVGDNQATRAPCPWGKWIAAK